MNERQNQTLVLREFQLTQQSGNEGNGRTEQYDNHAELY